MTASPPLLIFIRILLWATFFSTYIGAADPWWRAKEWAAFTAGSLWLAYRAWRSPLPIREGNLWAALLFAWVVIQMFLQNILPIVTAGSKYGSSMWPWICFLQLIIAFVWFSDASTCLSREDFRKVYRTFSLIGWVLSVHMLLQALNLDPLMWLIQVKYGSVNWIHGNHVVGLMGNPFQAGITLAVLAPAMAVSGWGALLGFMALLCTQSASAILSGSLGILLVLWLSGKRRWAVGIVSLLICGVFYAYQRELLSENGRLAIWELSLKAWATHPIEGIGIGMYKVLNLIDPTPPGYALRWAHNEWIQLLAELGLIGGSLAVLWALSLLRHVRRLSPVLLGTLVSCLALTPLAIPWHLAPSAVVTLLALAAHHGSVRDG